MYARRPGHRFNRGRVASKFSGGGGDPLSIAAAAGYTAQLLSFIRSDLGVTPSGNFLQTAGTLGPVLGVAGSMASVVGGRVEIDSTAGGTALGQATFRYSTDGGSTWIQSGVLTGSNVNLTGAATGLQLQFLAGTYNTNQVYQSLLGSIQDQTGNGHDFHQDTYTVAPLVESVSGYAGIPAIRTDGTSQYFQNNSLGPLVSGADVGFTIVLVMEATTANSHIAVNFGNSGQNTKSFHELQYISGGQIACNRNDDTVAGGASLKVRATPAFGGSTSPHRYIISFSGTDIAFNVDGVDQAPLSGTDLNVGTCTFDQLTIGARRGVSASLQQAARYYEFQLLLNGAPSAQWKSDTLTYLAGRYH